MSRAFLNRINGRKPAWDAADKAERRAPAAPEVIARVQAWRAAVPPEALAVYEEMKREQPCRHPAGEDCGTCGPATQRKPAAGEGGAPR